MERQSNLSHTETSGGLATVEAAVVTTTESKPNKSEKVWIAKLKGIIIH